jgi:hypothetical protein
MGRLDVWTPGQRGVLIGLVMCLTILVAVRWSINRAYVSDPQPADAPQARDLADRIDPNTSDAATLSALPLIGERRAADIIAYRERFSSTHHDRPAFRQIEDLMIVRGIGQTTIDQLRPYLIFPAAPSTATSRASTAPNDNP